MKARHFYATTGNRPLLGVEIITADGQKAVMGDVLETSVQSPELNVKINGTAPVDYVEIHNGLEIIHTMRPYNESDLGREVKIVWSGAEVRGRDRKSTWDGTLEIHDNNIRSFVPMNFWNPNSQPKQIGPNVISWKSITTGGITGVIAALEDPYRGNLKIRTNQIDCDVNLSSVGLKPLVYDAGGVRKRLKIYRLPQKVKAACVCNFSLVLDRLENGDNLIYVKVVQQDGHMAWSSHIYLVKT